NPGYIKGYLPGVRENGAQYTHAAVWVAMAFAALGDAAQTWEIFTMLDPVRHADSAAAVGTYMTEPYVMASDVYSLPPNCGRGGWTWYTGSAGWMYRLVVESMLGLDVQADTLRIVPCIPEHWTGYTLRYRYRSTPYRVVIERVQHASAPARIMLDGVECRDAAVTLVDDGREHAVTVQLAGHA
ncbi:MAG: glycosyl hydrolase family 65 protein, partial [Casimicrobiaceae bacterium]